MGGGTVVENVNIPDLAINYRSPESLVGYAQNARTHTDAQIDQIANSIRNFGWTNPILVDSNNGVIAGHGRVLAARKLGLTRVPVIALAHLTLDQKRAYILADNQLALNAGWDKELLALELGELKDAGFELELIGFSGDELQSLTDKESAGLFYAAHAVIVRLIRFGAMVDFWSPLKATRRTFSLSKLKFWNWRHASTFWKSLTTALSRVSWYAIFRMRE
jgi:hypothetical protein